MLQPLSFPKIATQILTLHFYHMSLWCCQIHSHIFRTSLKNRNKSYIRYKLFVLKLQFHQSIFNERSQAIINDLWDEVVLLKFYHIFKNRICDCSCLLSEQKCVFILQLTVPGFSQSKPFRSGGQKHSPLFLSHVTLSPQHPQTNN